MTITNQTNKTIQVGNGITQTFNFAFPIFNASDLKVYKYLTSSTEATHTPLTITTDYTVTISSTTEGGSVTFVETPLATETIAIIRDLSYTQTTDIDLNGNFPEVNVENALDKNNMLAIQLKEQVDRALKISQFFTEDFSGEVQAPVDDRALVWKTDLSGAYYIGVSTNDPDEQTANATAQAVIATTQAGIATTQAGLASGYATQAEGYRDDTQAIYDSLAQATTTTYGLSIFNKNFIYGLVPSSSVGVPDEDIDITAGKTLCKDDSTIVSLDTAVTSLSMPTLLGSALANSTTYHLFRYKKNDNTDQWYLATSLTPTITNIKSANAYRRIFSFETDSSGNIIHFTSSDRNGRIFYKFETIVLTSSSAPGSSLAAIKLLGIPTGFKANALISINASSGVGTILYLSEGYSSGEYEVNQNNTGGAPIDYVGFVETNISGQIKQRYNTAVPLQYELSTIAYEDYRIND